MEARWQVLKRFQLVKIAIKAVVFLLASFDDLVLIVVLVLLLKFDSKVFFLMLQHNLLSLF